MHTIYLNSIRQHKVAATETERRKFFTLKDLANEMDNHPRTAKKWWKKLGVPPDIRGHGPHRWRITTAKRLLELYVAVFNARGTTPQITRAKFAGIRRDTNQLELQISK